MIKTTLCCWLVLLSNIVLAQSSFDQIIEQLNSHLDQYTVLHPYDDYVALADLALSKKEKKAFVAEALDYNVLTATKDSVETYYAIEHFQIAILELLEQLIAHEDFGKEDVSTLLKAEEYDLSIVVSDDKKLYNFSLDAKTGGTYRSRLSLMHFTDIAVDSLSENYQPYLVFEGDGFDAIHTLQTKEGIKYVLTGYVRGCSYCFETHIMLVEFKEGVFIPNFSYAVSSRSWEEGVSYDASTKTITVDYETDDLTPECDCSNYADPDTDEYSYDYDDETFVYKRCHCTFEFNGSNFELTKECWEKLKVD